MKARNCWVAENRNSDGLEHEKPCHTEALRSTGRMWRITAVLSHIAVILSLSVSGSSTNWGVAHKGACLPAHLLLPSKNRTSWQTLYIFSWIGPETFFRILSVVKRKLTVLDVKRRRQRTGWFSHQHFMQTWRGVDHLTVIKARPNWPINIVTNAK